MRTRHLLLASAGLAACADPVTATVVTVEARPAVREVETLEVTFANDNATVMQTFVVDGRGFPLTFSIETPGRTGDLTMTARALAEDGALAALGAATSTIVTDEVVDARMMLDPADFLVNTSVAGDQKLAWGNAQAGTQIAAAPDGGFTIGFSDDCGTLGRCDLWGRRFDVRAVPLETEIQASDAQFNINRSDVFGNDPSLAISEDGTLLAAWSDFENILAVTITPAGGPGSPFEEIVSTNGSADDATVAALPGNRFCVVWTETDPNNNERLVRGRLVDELARPIVNPETGSTAPFTIDTAPGGFPDSPDVVATGNGLEMGFVWVDGSTVRARFTNAEGRLQPNQQIDVVVYDAFDDVWGPRIVPTEDGRYVLAWGYRTFDGALNDGGIVVRKVAPPLATAIGADSILARGLPDAFTRFSLTRADGGAYAVAWHACGAGGDENDCGVRARLFRDTGLPVGDAMIVNTTTTGSQTTPSIAWLGAAGEGAYAVTWTDESGLEPDTSEAGVRARVIYPAFAEARAVIGAECGGDAPCGDGLVCLEGTDAVTRCHAACDPAGPDPDCPDGGVCTTVGTESGCKL